MERVPQSLGPPWHNTLFHRVALKENAADVWAVALGRESGCL